MKYLSFVRMAETYRSAPPPPALMEAMGRFVQQAVKDGVLIDTGGLAPSKDGALLRLSAGEITVTDGPFLETTEIIGGWAILAGDSKAEVMRTATAFVELHKEHWPGLEMECEVRLMDGGFKA